MLVVQAPIDANGAEPLARAALAALQARARALFDSSALALVRVDARGRVLELSAAAADLFGAGASAGVRLAELAAFDAPHVLLSAVVRARSDGSARAQVSLGAGPRDRVPCQVACASLGEDEVLLAFVASEDPAWGAVAAALLGLRHALSQLAGGRHAPPADDQGLPELIGESARIVALRDAIARMATTDLDVLVTGETGTGKELVARALHRLSGRAAGPFVAIDCGAIPSALLEAELFGHERGAFTGADARRVGLLEAASGGTFFMDEVGELPLELQAKLLRVLQERRIRRVGGTDELDVDLRVVAATGRDLEAAVRAGAFRKDLFFRLDVLTLELPPLRDRPGDVRLLAEAFRAHSARRTGRAADAFTSAAVRLLEAYAWPGNVRELQNTIGAAVALSRGPVIDVADLPERLRAEAGATGDGGGYAELRARCVAQFEREFVRDMLARADGDVRAAARLGGMARGSFYRLLKRHGLDPEAFRRPGQG